MILVLDIGNSNIKIGEYQDDILKQKLIINTNKFGTVEYYEKEIKNNVIVDNVDGIAISSVVPEITNIIKEALNFLKCKTVVVNDLNTKINLKITQEERKTRGTDIIADITAGAHKYKENFIIADFGTAIVISVIGKNTEILGSSILPSVPIIINALAISCSQLNNFELECNDKIIGKTTIDALNGGIFWLMADGVSGIINRLKNKYNVEKVCFTGGMSRMFREYMNFESDFEENLTLNGIYQIFKLNME
jgi:type III pantothenate kinase